MLIEKQVKLKEQSFNDARRMFTNEARKIAIAFIASRGELATYENTTLVVTELVDYILRDLSFSDIVLLAHPSDPTFRNIKKWPPRYTLITAEKRSTWLELIIYPECANGLNKESGYLKDLFSRIDSYIVGINSEDSKVVALA